MVDLQGKLTQSQFGGLVGISQPAVSDLIGRGVLSEGAIGVEWVREYCGHLREIAAGRVADGDLDLAGERARLAKEQADRIAMQNAERRGELAPVALLETVLANAGTKVGRILDTIVPQIRRRVPGVPAEVLQTIENDIAKCRNLAASMVLSDLDDDDEAVDVETEETEVVDA